MRLDAHHSFSPRYPLAVLDTILKRNRFDGSILVASSIPEVLPSFVRGVIVEAPSVDPHALDRLQLHPLFRGPCTASGDFAELTRRNLTLDFSGPLTQLPPIAEAHPDLRIAFLLTAGADLSALARCPNIYCKLAGIVANRQPLVQSAIDAFGPGRLMFASLWPSLLPEHAWKAALAGFTQSIGARTMEFREQLLGDTAARFYGIAT